MWAQFAIRIAAIATGLAAYLPGPASAGRRSARTTLSQSTISNTSSTRSRPGTSAATHRASAPLGNSTMASFPTGNSISLRRRRSIALQVAPRSLATATPNSASNIVSSKRTTRVYGRWSAFFRLSNFQREIRGSGLGAGHVRVYLPVWLQKSFGDWTTYGGGGYWINHGGGTMDQNYWFFGWLLQKKVTDKLVIGGEIFHQTADTIGGKTARGSISVPYTISMNTIICWCQLERGCRTRPKQISTRGILGIRSLNRRGLIRCGKDADDGSQSDERRLPSMLTRRQLQAALRQLCRAASLVVGTEWANQRRSALLCQYRS